MAGILDQHQDSSGTGFGHGEFAVNRYRGQVFTPALPGTIVSLGFDRSKGAKDTKVYLDTASANVPDHAVGSELYSWIIPNASLVDSYGVYDLPTPLALTVGTKYCFYLAPFSGGSYSDEYMDNHGVASGSVEMTYNGGWFNENLTFHYATYMAPIVPTWNNIPSSIYKKSLRPRIFAPGRAR